MPEAPLPWWYKSESVTAHQLRGGYDRLVQRIQLTFGATFKAPAERPWESPSIGIRIGTIQVGAIERRAYGFVVHWNGDKTRSAYTSWMGALRGGEPPIYADGGGVVFNDVESVKTAVASFLAYYVSDVNLGSLMN